VKRIPALRDLSDDHHTGLVLARRCRQAGPSGRERGADEIWARVIEAFEAHLEPHFRIEEEHLLPGLEAIGEAGLATRIRDDHRALRALRGAKAVDVRAIERFGELLEAHIRFEEREVFETTQDRLPAVVLDAIAAACAEVPRVCPDWLR